MEHFRATFAYVGALGRYLGSSCRSWAPSCRQVAPRLPQDGANMSLHSAKMSQDSLQEQPQDPKNLQKCCTVVTFLVFSFFGKIAPKIQKKSPRYCQKRAKLTILSPSCSKIAPDGANMSQHSAKMSQDSLQEQPQDLQKTSKSAVLSSFFWFSQFSARSRPRFKKSRQDAAKSAPS